MACGMTLRDRLPIPNSHRGTGMRDSRALFVSPVQPIGGCSANVYNWNKLPARVRIAMSFLNHPGLCFLKANTPCDILEYPTQDMFDQALVEPPDILGISFYINETELALRMAQQARRAGVREIWAGNFGAYSPQVDGFFDRIFSGWSEIAVAQALGSPPVSPQEFVHPEIYGAIGSNLLPNMIMSGILFTSRGCPWTCNFCQTPSFYGKVSQIPLEAIDKVLWTYKRNGIVGINILDENFGTFRKHASEVVRLLHRHGMRWIALTRVDTLLKHFDNWVAHGLFGAHLGIESLNQMSLSGASKRIEKLDSVRLLTEMSQHNMFVQSFYILGFEQDTVASVREDIETLAGLDTDVVQVQVLTPYPRTELRTTIENQYGILNENLSMYNSRNLVWGHPNISPDEMRELQAWAHSKLSSSRRAWRTISKFALYFGRSRPNFYGVRLLANGWRRPERRLKKALAPQLASAREWARVPWSAYEEVPAAASLTEKSATVLT